MTKGNSILPEPEAQSAESALLASTFAAESLARALIAQADPKGATIACRHLYSESTSRYCWVVLGDQFDAHAAAGAVWGIIEERILSVDLTTTLRCIVMGFVRRYCATLVETACSRGVTAISEKTEHAFPVDIRSTAALRLVMQLRPSDRELLVLRFLNNLTYTELGKLWELSEDEVRTRVSQALVRALTTTSGSFAADADHGQRCRFDAQLAEIIDRTAPRELSEIIASSDRLRDARHQAEQFVAGLTSVIVDEPLPEAKANCKTDGSNEPATESTASGSPLTSGNNVAPNLEKSDSATAFNADVVQTPEAKDSANPVPESAAKGGVFVERRKVASWITLSTVAVVATVAWLWGASATRLPRLGSQLDRLQGKVAHIEGVSGASRVELCTNPKGPCRVAVVGARIGRGMLLRTNSSARVSIDFDNGATLALDRATVVELPERGDSQLVLNSGTIVVDANQDKANALVVDFPTGRAELEHAKCAIAANEAQTQLEVTRGRVRLAGLGSHERILHAGETCRLSPNQEPRVTYSRTTGDIIAGSELPDTDESRELEATRGLGQLRAQKPGETNERESAVRLTRHHAKIRIVGAVARTEVDETFTNDTNDVLEGIFRFPLPADAQIERLALEVDGRLVDGAFTDRERASAIWRGSIVQAAPQLRAQIKDEIIWVPGPWRDPALLEWQRGNRFELRIFPIPKQGSRRIVLSYTQVVPGLNGFRRYSYPLPSQLTNQSGIADFSMNFEIRGHDAAHSPTVLGYDGQLSNPSSEVSSFSLNESQFSPRGDLVVSYQLPIAQQDLVAWAYQSTDSRDDPYAAILLRPRMPNANELTSRTYAFVVDSSRSMIGESLHRATAMIARMIGELSCDDQVVVLACDSECRVWPDGMLNGGKTAAESARRWLRTQTAEGASDLVGAIGGAVAAIEHSSAKNPHIVYVGDGTPTMGATRPATIVRDAGRHLGAAGIGVTAIAIGSDSDLESLRTLAQAGRGVVVPYAPGTSLSRASYSALAATFGTRLTDVHVELPAGFVGIAPSRFGTVAAGDELLIVGRLTNPAIRGDVVLHGRVEGRDFEQRFAIELGAVSGDSNAFVPRLYAAARIADLEHQGDDGAKKEAIALSQRFSVASRYTSLLVLESQAMFKAFSLDNRRQSHTWTGELEASSAGLASADDATSHDEQSDNYSASDFAAKAKEAPSMRRATTAGAVVAAPAFAPAPASAADAAESSAVRRKREIALELERQPEWEPPQPRRRLIPMRRIWERRGEVIPGRMQPSTTSDEKIAAAERELAQNPNHRVAVKRLYDLYAKNGDLNKSSALVENWSARDPMDVEALIARADIAARRGERADAIRMLGSVVDVRPGDVGAQQRLSRLYRWQGQSELACRFSLALAEFRPNDEKALAEALRCLNEGSRSELAEALKHSAASQLMSATERLLSLPRAMEKLSGDLRVNVKWQGADEVDLDVAFIDPDAHRVSWLGAPTRAVITATTVTSQKEEGLALRGGKPGEYLLEVVRSQGKSTVNGTAIVHVAGTERTISFTLDGDRAILGVVKLDTVSKLVPLSPSTAFRIAE